MQEWADHFGIILDKGWSGLTETEAAWDLVTRLAFGMECFVGLALALCVGFEMTGYFRVADNLAICLFAVDMLSNVVPCLVNFEGITLAFVSCDQFVIFAIFSSLACFAFVHL